MAGKRERETMRLELLCCAVMPLVFGVMFGIDALRDWRNGVKLRKTRHPTTYPIGGRTGRLSSAR